MTEAKTSRVSSAEAVANLWNEMGVSYLVLHGLEGYPEQIGRDLDILMDQDVAETALAAAAGLLTERGWRCVRPPDLWGKRLVAIAWNHMGGIDFLELHTVGVLSWIVLPLVGASEGPTHYVGEFPVNHWASFLKAFITPLVARDLARFDPEYISGNSSALARNVIRGKCASYFGHDLGGVLLRGLETADPSLLIECAAPIQRNLVMRMARGPINSLRCMPAFLGKRIMLPFSSSGLHIELSAPSGWRTSELTTELSNLVTPLFTRIDIRTPESPARSAMELVRLMARQGLAVDCRDDLASDSSFLIAAVKSKRSRLEEIRFPIDATPVLANEIANWVLTGWLDYMKRNPQMMER